MIEIKETQNTRSNDFYSQQNRARMSKILRQKAEKVELETGILIGSGGVIILLFFF